MKDTIYKINKELSIAKNTLSKYTVAFYHQSNKFEPWDFAIPLLEYLQEKNFHAIILIGYDKDIYSDKITSYKIHSEDIILLKNLDALIVIDSTHQIYPATTRVLAIAHGFVACRRTDFRSLISHQCNYDGYLTNIPLQESANDISQLWTGFYSINNLRNTSNFHIISCGYLRAATLRTRINAQSAIQPDAICYAPIDRTYRQNIGGDRILKYGMKILRILLTEFPERKIIFRPPFSYTAQDPEILAIADIFSSNKNFSLDVNPDRFFCFANSAVLITDFSHIANSFSFTTYRPSIYFQPWLAKFLPHRVVTGYYTYTFTQLIKTIKTCLFNLDNFQECIHNASKTLTMPLENSFEEFHLLLLSFIKDNFSNINRDNHITIHRNYNSFDYVKSLYKYISQTNEFPLHDSTYNFTEKLPICISTLAYAKINPNGHISKELTDRLCLISNSARQFKTFIEAKTLCTLFIKNQLLYFIKTNNIEGIFICQKILEYSGI